MKLESKEKLISERFFNASQSWHYDLIISDGSRKLRIDILRNAYDEQSYCRGFVLDGLHWSEIVGRPIQLCHCKTTSYVDRSPSRELFEQDARDVLHEMKAVLQ